jgi:GDP-mannose 6-dehydrogenase
MKIAIFGLGYVGVTAAVCIASEGHAVLGVDVNEAKIRQVNSGVSPVKEPGVDERLRQFVSSGLIRCTSDIAEAIGECDGAIVCVGTPSLPDGSHNMSFIVNVSQQIARAMSPGRLRPLTVIFRSTMRPGTMEHLITPIFQSVLGEANDGLELVYNPEFLREATAIEDYFNPPKIVIGTRDGQPNAVLSELNRNISAKTFCTRFREAEITKFVDNSFHAVKVAFANEIGRVCQRLGISATTVHEIFVSDTKLNISPYYLRPGGAFGGSCLPKDVRALQYLAADVGAPSPLLDSLLRSNDAHKHFLFDTVSRSLSPGAKVLMIGLAFKSNSDDLRESPKVDMARKLLDAGFQLSVFDPWLKQEHLIGQNLGYGFMHLPTLPQLLISQELAEETHFDLVIDTVGLASEMKLSCEKLVNLHALL